MLLFLWLHKNAAANQRSAKKGVKKEQEWGLVASGGGFAGDTKWFYWVNDDHIQQGSCVVFCVFFAVNTEEINTLKASQ